MCVYACIYTYMHVATISEKRGHEYEGECAGVYKKEGLDVGNGREK